MATPPDDARPIDHQQLHADLHTLLERYGYRLTQYAEDHQGGTLRIYAVDLEMKQWTTQSILRRGRSTLV